MNKRNSQKSATITNAVPNEERTAIATAQPAGTEQNSPIQKALGAIFQNDSIVRAAIASNLKERSIASKAFTSRAHQAFASFKPSKYSKRQAPVDQNYLKLGDSLVAKQHDVINRGLDAFRNSTTTRSIRLTKSVELDKLIEAAPPNGNSLVGTIALTPLMSYIEAKLEGRHPVARDTIFTSCKAEIEAERRMAEICGDAAPKDPSAGTDKPPVKNDDDPAGPDPDALELTADKLVRDNVDLQMDMATSPESELRYSIPAQSDQMKDKHDKPTFELRTGASDVTAFHDFHNLQIAFEDVWTEMFDGQLAVLGKQLYEEYVKLKTFGGADDGMDPTISTIDDLKQLMAEVRAFTQQTVQNVSPAVNSVPNAANGTGGSAAAGAGLGAGIGALVLPFDPLTDALIGAAIAYFSGLRI